MREKKQASRITYYGIINLRFGLRSLDSSNYEQNVNILLIRTVFPLHLAYFGVYLTYRVLLGLYRFIFYIKSGILGFYSPKAPFIITI